MAKSIKLKNETYIDSSSVVHDRTTLNNILKDTGWRDIIFYSGFSDFADWTTCKARKIGDVIYIKGAVKGFSSINYTQFAKLPNDFRGNTDNTVQFIVPVINKASTIAVLNIGMNTGIMVLTSANSSVSSSDGININCSFCLY